MGTVMEEVQLNDDGMPIGVPLTPEQIAEANARRGRMAAVDSPVMRAVMAQRANKKRRDNQEAEPE